MNTTNRKGRAFRRGEVDPQVLLVFGSVMVIIVTLAILLFSGDGGYGGKLLLVVRRNVGFWVMMTIAVVFGVYRKVTNPDHFHWHELPAQLAVSLVSLLLLSCFFFSTSANLTDTEILNGHVTGAEYYEEWTEKVTDRYCPGHGSGENRRTCGGCKTRTRRVYHAPYWEVHTTVSSLSVNAQTYRNVVNRFGNERKVNLFRSDQVSHGDGNKFETSFNPSQAERLIPASVPHDFVNYLQASESVKKIRGHQQLFPELIRPYPQVYAGHFGRLEIDRVVDAGVGLPATWKRTVDRTLEEALVELGRRKQVNVIVYAAKTADQTFAYALDQAWNKGKKNDVVVVLGLDAFPKVSFAHVMAWTKVEQFPINLRNRILELPDLRDGKALASAIVEEISKPASQGGFERSPMSDLEYLIADIELPMWAQILIVLLGGAASWGTSSFLIKNDF